MAEIERLRARNRKLESEVKVLQENLINNLGDKKPQNTNQRLYDELQML